KNPGVKAREPHVSSLRLMGLLTLVSPSSTWESTTPQAEKLAHAGIEARPKRSMFNTRVPVLARFGIGRLSSTHCWREVDSNSRSPVRAQQFRRGPFAPRERLSKFAASPAEVASGDAPFGMP